MAEGFITDVKHEAQFIIDRVDNLVQTVSLMELTDEQQFLDFLGKLNEYSVKY